VGLREFAGRQAKADASQVRKNPAVSKICWRWRMDLRPSPLITNEGCPSTGDSGRERPTVKLRSTAEL
jgi:hypothetical protein